MSGGANSQARACEQSPTAACVRNGQSIAVADIPLLAIADFRAAILGEIRSGARLVALFGRPVEARESGRPASRAIRLLAVVGHDDRGVLSLRATEVERSYEALTPECPSAQGFEREIAEQWGIRPEGHPWLKPLRFHAPYLAPDERTAAIGDTEFFRVEGEEVHEVAVGPVHAGIIEPGHFRFQCHGERVLHLEISLGYQHRGIERALVGGPHKRAPHYLETTAGDTSIGHATAYCHLLEALSGRSAPARGAALRAIALELERLANHTGDLGALANDVGYLPTASYCGRIRGDFLNMTALVSGSRFGRGWAVPGGSAFDIDAERADELAKRLTLAARDVAGAVELLWRTPSVMGRFEGIGVIAREDCQQLGLVGLVARASGIDRDVRRDFPSGIFRYALIPVSTLDSGDVFARAFVRQLEIQRSVAFIAEQLRVLPIEPARVPIAELAKDRVAVSLQEGFRGEICHVAETDSQGHIAAYKIIDPSFHNWFGLAMALRGEKISDFPLCNKSFNLSYCGHDL